MYAFRHSEIRVDRVVTDELLLETDVGRVDARIGVILAENGHARLEGKCSWRKRLDGRDSRVRWRRTTRRIFAASARGRSHRERKETCACGDLLLLDAVRGNGADLRQHILACIENAITRAQDGLALAANVPGKTDAGLKFLVLIWELSGGREGWI